MARATAPVIRRLSIRPVVPTMIQIESQNPELAIRSFVLGWMKLLAGREYDHACAQIDEPNSYGIVWDPDQVLRMLHDTFGPDTRFVNEHHEGPQFSYPSAIKNAPAFEIIAFNDGSWTVFRLAIRDTF